MRFIILGVILIVFGLFGLIKKVIQIRKRKQMLFIECEKWENDVDIDPEHRTLCFESVKKEMNNLNKTQKLIFSALFEITLVVSGVCLIVCNIYV
jgi:hypothetical protein